MAADWPDTVQMKAVVSATIFCNLATLPKEMMSDAGTAKLSIQPKGGYAENEKLTQRTTIPTAGRRCPGIVH